MMTICCNAEIIKAGRQIYCSTCLVELCGTERDKYLRLIFNGQKRGKRSPRARKRMRYYRNKWIEQGGYLSVRQTAALKCTTPSVVLRNLHQFHVSMRPTLRIKVDQRLLKTNLRTRHHALRSKK